MYHRIGFANIDKFIKKNNIQEVDTVNNLFIKSFEQLKVDGLYIEFGVSSGLTVNMIADLNTNKIIYGFDSFDGLPEDYTEIHKKGAFIQSQLPSVRSNVKLIKGLFQDTLSPFLDNNKEKVAFLHIDCDLYSATKHVFEQLADRIQVGTVIQFDELFEEEDVYWYIDEYKAFKELAIKKQFTYKFIGYCNCRCSLIITGINE